MKNCKFCDKEIQDDASKCRHCGKFLNEIDLKKYGFEDYNYNLSIDNITEIDGPHFMDRFEYGKGPFGAITNVMLNLEWNINYTPPHMKYMMGQVVLVFPHYVVQVKSKDIWYQFALKNIGYKSKAFGRYDKGTMDPRIQEFYDDIKSGIVKKNEKIIANKNKKTFDGNKDINDDTYQLYLVDKYKITKNDTLGKFVLNNKPYKELSDVLHVAHELEVLENGE